MLPSCPSKIPLEVFTLPWAILFLMLFLHKIEYDKLVLSSEFFFHKCNHFLVHYHDYVTDVKRIGTTELLENA